MTSRGDSPGESGPASCGAPDGGDESKFVRVEGHRVHYRRAGDGDETLVFLHGWACDQSFWDGQFETWRAKTGVIAIDLPGHGRSDQPEIEYSMGLFADSVRGVLDAEGVGEAVLVGHSNGAAIALGFYRRYPERTKALVSVEGPLRNFFTPEAAEGAVTPLRGPDYAGVVEGMAQGMLPASLDPALRERLIGAMAATPQHVLISSFQAVSDPAEWSDAAISVPLLVLLAESPFWTPDYEDYVRRLAPQVDYRVYGGTSHFLMLERPALFDEALHEFLWGTYE